MSAFIVTIAFLSLTGYVIGKDALVSDVSHRQGKIFPFHTIGRFQNVPCTATGGLTGTCVLNGECSDAGGIRGGACGPSAPINGATCCIYQMGCGVTTSQTGVYLSSAGYPGTFAGGNTCTYNINKCATTTCQLRIDFLDFALAPPTGDGVCLNDVLIIRGGASPVPRICGYNTGQHVYVPFGGGAITIQVLTTASFAFNRRWNFLVTQIDCSSGRSLAPSGCLQYFTESTGTVSSFNYIASASPGLNAIGVTGTNQLANTNYGICVAMAAGQCSITWQQASNDPYSFTMTADVGSVAQALLGTAAVQSQVCTTDYVTIPTAFQNGVQMPQDRFCGLGLLPTTSNNRPFVLYTRTDANENADIGNRGFSLSYSQNSCPV